jgi:hypothetical protein
MLKTKIFTLTITLLLLCVRVAQAHQSDLSSIMIYEQNGKYLLLMKSSLTAFEGEIDYHYKKEAYKTPEEFMQLVVNYFDKSCSIIINNENIRFINPHVILGHETTFVAELANTPQEVKSLYLKNTFFKDIPNNQCELIFTTKGLPQKQYVLNNENNQEVNLSVKQGQWVVETPFSSFFKDTNVLLWGAIFLLLSVAVTIIIRKERKQ